MPNRKMGQIAIAILAAGRGSRFGGDSPKPLALLGERSLVSMALGAAVESGIAPVLLVVGYADKQVAAVAPPNVRVVYNPDWQQGIASSLQAALRTLEPDNSVEAVCIGLADQPFVGADSYRRLAAAYREGASIAVATYGGARRNPVLLARSMWRDAMKLEGDEGARVLMRTQPVVEVNCDRTGNPLDIDTHDDINKSKVMKVMKNKCIVISSKGGSDKLKLVEKDIPEPESGQVRVKILAAGVSSADILMREGVYPVDPPSFPFIPGYDIVGIIDECGQDSKKFEKGQTVAALTKIGGYAEYICLSENDLVLVPTGLESVEAVAIILNYLTAYQMLHRIAEAKEGEKMLVYAAAGGVGTALLELGRVAGLEMYGTASSRKHETISQLGATPIDYKSKDVIQEIKRLTTDGVDIVFDSIGGENCFRSYRTIREEGRVVTFGASFALNQKEPDLQEVFFWWRASLALNLLSDTKKVLTYAIATFKQEHHDWYLEDLEILLNLLANHKIKPVISKVMPLSEAAKAHQLLDRQEVTGKIVLVP